MGAYHALKCDRIYTIFVPMPSANWTLQYCQQGGSQGEPDSSTKARTVQIQEGLIPPDPVEKFDFRRLPVPADKPHPMLVIKGVVRDDGVVDNLDVFQGVLREMDETAVAALKKWKFVPARRGTKPVAVQILVGIPFSAPAAR